MDDAHLIVTMPVKRHIREAYNHLIAALDLMDKAPPDHRVETIQGNVNAAANEVFRARRRMGWLEE